MQYGFELPNMCPGGDAQALVELACLAEEAGWDGVFLEDYIVHWSAKDAPTQERALIRALADAGATWWVEYIPPDALEDMQACIERVRQGPLRIE